MAAMSSKRGTVERATQSEQNYLIRESNMPDEFRILLAEYPREGWEHHPGFHQPTRNWLGAHLMFRRLSTIIRTDLENYLDRRRSVRDTLVQLTHYGMRLSATCRVIIISRTPATFLSYTLQMHGSQAGLKFSKETMTCSIRSSTISLSE